MGKFLSFERKAKDLLRFLDEGKHILSIGLRHGGSFL